MNENTSFAITLNWLSDFEGELRDGSLREIVVTVPSEVSKKKNDFWSPEHLLVAAVNSCLMTTFLSIAQKSKLEVAAYRCEAVGRIEKTEGKYRFFEVELNPVISVTNEKDIERADRLIRRSEEYCLISNSINAAVKLNPKVKLRLVLR